MCRLVTHDGVTDPVDLAWPASAYVDHVVTFAPVAGF
jgi:hypothetical protein